MLFWLGLVAAVPLSIVANLITPYIQRWLESKSEQAASKKTLRTRAEYEQISVYRNNPTEFTQYLIFVAVQIAALSAAIGVIFGLLDFIGFTFSMLGQRGTEFFQREWIYAILSAVFPLFSIFGSLLIFQIARTALST